MSASILLGSTLLAALAAIVAVLVFRARKWQRRVKLSEEHEFWNRAVRIVDKYHFDHTSTEDFLGYAGRMTRRKAFGSGVTHWWIYWRNRRVHQAARTIESGLFHTIMHFIPRQLRSPWFDHLLEDRERMAQEGRSRRFIAIATAIQCLSLVVHVFWERIWELLTPFKARSR